MERQEASHVTVVLNEAACCGPSVCVSERDPPAHLLYLVLRADRAARSAAAAAGSHVWICVHHTSLFCICPSPHPFLLAFTICVFLSFLCVYILVYALTIWRAINCFFSLF